VRAERRRLDLALVALGLAPSREQAQALVMAGDVTVDGQPARKPGQSVGPEARLLVRAHASRVGRGAGKLLGALEAFGVSPAGRVALDVGASTGGFTDCLLQRGARGVIAVDVGYGQLAWRLRQDPRVTVLDRMNARLLDPEALPALADIATVDVSFISLTKVLPAIVGCLQPSGTIVALVKPQFEVGRSRVGKGGVVRDEAARADAVAVVREAAEGLGFAVLGESESVLSGPKGNREVFLWLFR
jgi:23S rRNA (cytidine1920-2'-O)/16S rRNA (cytidine1409-2'-O)-methyltransferase